MLRLSCLLAAHVGAGEEHPVAALLPQAPLAVVPEKFHRKEVNYVWQAFRHINERGSVHIQLKCCATFLMYLYIMKSMASRTATARRLETTTAAISQLADAAAPALCIRGSALGVYGSACGGEIIQIQNYLGNWKVFGTP